MADSLLYDSVPNTFTRFPDLPPEIRYQIWYYLLPGPRVIHVVGSTRPNGGQCFVDTSDDPRLLRVCQESRAITRERYQLSFKPHLRNPIYFDFSSDTLLMQDDKVLSMFFERSRGPITPEVTRVKTIAVEFKRSPQAINMHIISQFLFVTRISWALEQAISRFGNLRDILLLTAEDHTESDLENSLRSTVFQTRMENSLKGGRDVYAAIRREFLGDEDGSIPATKLMTAVDFWNRFS